MKISKDEAIKVLEGGDVCRSIPKEDAALDLAITALNQLCSGVCDNCIWAVCPLFRKGKEDE